MGKTFMSLFKMFEKEELCQLYVFPTFPDVDMANSYYRITDKDAIKSIFRKTGTGGEVSVKKNNGSLMENKIDGRLYAKRSNNSPLRRLLRDVIWRFSNWNSEELREWLDKENPTCIFLAPGYAKFIYDIALVIAKERNIPIITYICDDYYFVRNPKGIIARYQLQMLQKKIRMTLNKTVLLVAISEEIRETYSEKFLLKAETIMTGTDIDCIVSRNEERTQIRELSYFGNMGINREVALADIGRALDEINALNKTDYKLNIYTKVTDEKILDVFLGVKSIKLKGFLTGEDYVRAFSAADCLVHAEAFDAESVDIIKNSISTKIPESLASGIPLLAYGPKGIASIEHARRTECAFVANSYDELKRVILELIQDAHKRRKYTNNALNVAKQYHSSDINSNYLKSVIKQITERTL